MITKTENIRSRRNLEYLTIEKFIELIKFGNNNTKTISRLRETEYKSKEYEKIKSELNDCVMMHGQFNSLRDDGLIKLSKYLFYDVDDIDDLESTKNELIKLGAYIIYKSPGGRGLHFIMKANGLTKQNFNKVYNSVLNYLFSLGIKIDKSAKGLSRKAYLSSDKEIYVGVGNDTFFISGDKISVGNETFLFGVGNDTKKVQLCGGQTKKKEEERYKGNDTFFKLRLIPISELTKQLKFKTDLELKGDVLINEMEWVDILIPKTIKDGSKHTIYRRIMFQLAYLNKEITDDELYSYLHHINLERATKPMEDITLRKLVINTRSFIKENEITIKMRKKKIHLNDHYSSKEKEELGGKINAILRNNESIRKIEEAKELLKKEGKKITRKNVAEITGLSLITVKRNFNEKRRDITMPEKVDDKSLEREWKLSQLVEDEEDFWEGFSVRNQYEEKGIEDEDFGEWDGIDGFIETIDI